ncbi:MAG: pyridoxal-phosphate dependent enzyme [Bacteroidia bacterium]|nr:pyridoxal-phosphate dependent enzyme [Bacteroidia bacterium]
MYPINEVSPVQKKQLESIGDNVQPLAIDGKFDDCQKLVKMAFADPDLAPLGLSSANSINIGRLIPQIIYYMYMYLQVSTPGQPVSFCVPSGNLGNSLGCELARRMGLPVRRILIATNANNAFPQFLRNQTYQSIEPSIECISNAMNVGNPSNLARYFDLYGGHVDKSGQVHQIPDWAAMQQVLLGYDFSDEETIQTIVETYDRYGTVVEPHGAVGLLAGWQYWRELPEERGYPLVCLETAHPAKFPEIIRQYLSLEPKNTPALERLNQRSGSSWPLANDYEALKAHLLQAG